MPEGRSCNRILRLFGIAFFSKYQIRLLIKRIHNKPHSVVVIQIISLNVRLMRKLTASYFVILFLFIFSSCQKELSFDEQDDPRANALLGDWKMVSLSAKTEVIDELTDGVESVKSITRSEYTSANMQGNIRFEDTKTISTGVSYDVSTTGYAEYYENEVLVDEFEAPFNISIPPTNSTASYKVVTADSLYFPEGFVVSGGLSAPAEPLGYRFKIEGENLTLSTRYFSTEKTTDAGIRQEIV